MHEIKKILGRGGGGGVRRGRPPWIRHWLSALDHFTSIVYGMNWLPVTAKHRGKSEKLKTVKVRTKVVQGEPSLNKPALKFPMRQFSTIYSTAEVICIQTSGLSMTVICSHNISNQNWLLGPGDCKQSSFICLMHQMHTKPIYKPMRWGRHLGFSARRFHKKCRFLQF